MSLICASGGRNRAGGALCIIRVEVLFLPLRFSFVGMGKFWSCAFTKNEQWAGAHICAGFALGCALGFTLGCALGFTLCSHG